MARISTYKNATPVVASDKWIGSDSQNNMETKNFTAQAVADFINKTGGQGQNLRYRYNETNVYETGTLSFLGGGSDSVLLNSITTIDASVFDTRSLTIDVSDFIQNALLDSDILLTDCSDITNWAIYTVNSVVKKGSNVQVTLGLTFKAGGGSLIANKDYFISLLKYAGANDANFLYTLDGSTNVYTIDHNLNKYPAVTIFDANNAEVETQIVFNSLNRATLTFSLPFTGKASFN